MAPQGLIGRARTSGAVRGRPAMAIKQADADDASAEGREWLPRVEFRGDAQWLRY
jgi:hypothetical protein